MESTENTKNMLQFQMIGPGRNERKERVEHRGRREEKIRKRRKGREREKRIRVTHRKEAERRQRRDSRFEVSVGSCGLHGRLLLLASAPYDILIC